MAFETLLMIIGSLVAIQSLLIAWLLILWRRKHQSESSLRCKTDELDQRLQFEELLADITMRFINLPPDHIDGVIEEAQRRVCEFLEVDLSSLWELSQDYPQMLYLTHHYRPLGGPPIPNPMAAEAHFPWSLRELSAGRVVTACVDTAPPEAARDKEMWRHFGLKSNLALPLMMGGQEPIGVLSFATMHETRNWPDPFVKQLRLLAQVFAQAIARKNADEALRESDTRLRLATEAAQAGLWIMDLQTLSVWVSDRTRAMFKFQPGETVTCDHFFQVIHPDDQDRVRQAVQQAQNTGEHLACEYRIVPPEGEGTTRWIGAYGKCYPALAPTRLMGVSLDITERKTAQEHQEALAHATRIAMMGELTTSLAHEINQPLTAILSNAEAALRFLDRTVPDIEEVRHILRDIITGANRAGGLISRVRSLAKKEKSVKTALDLNQAVAEILKLLQSDHLLQGLFVTTELSPTLIAVNGDRVQLQQVIVNLILNSAAAMQACLADQRKIVVRTIKENNQASVAVIDSGPGICEETMGRLFESFYTTKTEGLGMGLAISRHIIEDHGGSIAAANIPGGGAMFTFSLPTLEGASP